MWYTANNPLRNLKHFFVQCSTHNTSGALRRDQKSQRIIHVSMYLEVPECIRSARKYPKVPNELHSRVGKDEARELRHWHQKIHLTKLLHWLLLLKGPDQDCTQPPWIKIQGGRVHWTKLAPWPPLDIGLSPMKQGLNVCSGKIETDDFLQRNLSF